MRDGEWSLSHAGGTATFGLVDSPDGIFIAAPDLGDLTIEAADASRPRADGVNFGVDFHNGRTITVELGILGATEAAVLASVERLAGLWRADALRATPGATATLTMRHSGRERLVYGRPRRFAFNIDEAPQGYATVVADFAASDTVFYASTENTVTANIVPPPTGGGLLSPLATPLKTTLASNRSIVSTVTGPLPAWGIYEITGPITNPSVEVVGKWKLEFLTTLAAGSKLVIDTRPHARTIMTDGASTPGIVKRTSARLSDTAISPGNFEFALRGTSASGTATARLTWRDTYPTL